MKKTVTLLSVALLWILACAQFPNLNPKEIVAREAIKASMPLFEPYFDKLVPIAPTSRSWFPLEEPPTQLWKLGRYKTQVDGTLRLSAGEYWFPVRGFCMKASGSSPSGHLYRLSEIRGARAKMLRDLHTRGVAKKLSPNHIQFASWSLQSGARFEKFSAEAQKTVKDLIPEHIPALRESPFEKLRERWNQLASASQGRIPSFDSASDEFLDSLGVVGESLRDLRGAHDAIVRKASTYETFSERILSPGPSREKGGPRVTPWSKVGKGIYARFITQAAYKELGMLQVRVTVDAVLASCHPRSYRPALRFVPDLLQLIPDAHAEEQGCTESPGNTPFDPGALAGDPNNSGIQPLALGMAPPAPNPLVGAAMAGAAAAAIAAAMASGNYDPEAIAKALEDLGKQAAAADQAVNEAIRDYLADLLRWFQERVSGKYVPPPDTLPAFPKAVPVKPKAGRARWEDNKGKIYEWDGEKGEVEIYDSQGKNHEGGFDPKTGKQRSKAKKNRCTKK